MAIAGTARGKGIILRVSEERVSNYRRIALHSVRRAWLAPSKSNSFRTLGADLLSSCSPLFFPVLGLSLLFFPAIPPIRPVARISLFSVSTPIRLSFVPWHSSFLSTWSFPPLLSAPRSPKTSLAPVHCFPADPARSLSRPFLALFLSIAPARRRPA